MKNSYKIQCFLYGSPSAGLKKKGFESKGNIHIFKRISTSQFWAVSCTNKQTYWLYLLSTVNQDSRVCVSHPNPLNSTFNERKDTATTRCGTEEVQFTFGPVLCSPRWKAVSTDAGTTACARASPGKT